MARNSILKPGSAVGFWKFVIIGTVVFSILRSYFFRGSVWGATSSMFWYAVLAYGAYRVARLQPWWPFRVRGDDIFTQSDERPIPVQEVAPRPARLQNPITADHLKRKVANAAAKLPKAVTANFKPAMKIPMIDVTPISTTKGLILAQASNVGVRSKTVRQKVTRHKTQRQKRRPV